MQTRTTICRWVEKKNLITEIFSEKLCNASCSFASQVHLYLVSCLYGELDIVNKTKLQNRDYTVTGDY